MEVRKVFVSVPMRDISDEAIERNIHRLQNLMDQNETNVLYVFMDNHIEKPENEGPLYCLGEAIKKVGDCDYVLFDKSWRSYNGCCVEHLVAEKYNKCIVEETDNKLVFHDKYAYGIVKKTIDIPDPFAKFMNLPIESLASKVLEKCQDLSASLDVIVNNVAALEDMLIN